MKCPVISAKVYQAGFSNNLILTGFRKDIIFGYLPEWLGNTKNFAQYWERLRLLSAN